MPPKKKIWITPMEAATEISKRVGFKVTPDDLKQMRRRGKIKKQKKITDNLILYNVDEIQTVTAPKKRNPEPVSNGLTGETTESEH